MDERYSVHARGSVAIGGGSILAIGDIAAEYEPKQTIDCAGRVVMPGLVNAHTHVAMAMLRGLADDLRLDVWLLGYMMPVERQFVRPDFVALGTNLGCAEMIRSGTTCFADMYYFEEVVAETAAAAGLRAVCAQTVLKFPAPDAASFEDSLARAREFITRWKGHSRIVPAVAPHAPYTCTAEILRACAELASEFDSSAAHPPGRNGARGRTVPPRARHAGGAVGQKTGSVRRAGALPLTACTSTRRRCGR